MDNSNNTSTNLTELSKFLVGSWQQYLVDNNRSNEETLEVFQVFGFIARIYERIRATVENKGEQVIRRFAIERALKRPDSDSLDNPTKADRLIRELTWSRFLPNNFLTRSQYDKLVKVLDKYQLLESQITQLQPLSSDEHNWMLEICSAEIEELLMPSFTRSSLVPAFCLWAQTSFKFHTEPEMADDELSTQIYVAAHRAIAKSDGPIIQFYLLTFMYPNWTDTDFGEVGDVAAKFTNIKTHLYNIAHHPQKNKLYRWVRQNTAPFLFLETLFESQPNPDQILSNKHQFIEQIESIANEKYRGTKEAIRRGIIQSFMYILVTKVLIAFALEYPYEKFVTHSTNALAIGINLTLPPLLMILMGTTVKAPDQRNTELIINKLNRMLYADNPRPPVIIRFSFSPATQRWTYIFNAIYAYLFIVVCLVVGYILRTYLDFNIVSLGLFFMFLSLILLFGFRLRWQSQELLVSRPPQGLLGNLFAMLTMPFINLGVWLSSTISKVNVITFLLDKFIDAPLKSSVNSAEEWSKFIRDRRVDAVEIPRD